MPVLIPVKVLSSKFTVMSDIGTVAAASPHRELIAPSLKSMKDLPLSILVIIKPIIIIVNKLRF